MRIAWLLLGCTLVASAQQASRESLDVYVGSGGIQGDDTYGTTGLADNAQQAALAASIHPQALTQAPFPAGINYTCDPAVNAIAGVCNYLNTTISALYASVFTNANATIYVTFGTTSLGSSRAVFSGLTYTAYRNALQKSLTSADDFAAFAANVPAVNPIDPTYQLQVASALFRALGFTPVSGIAADGSICKLVDGACYDGVITISSAEQAAGNLYFRNGTITPTQYDFYTVIQHETDEILHIGSCVGQCVSSGITHIAPADLYRYQSNGARSYAVGNNSPCSSPNAGNACFSIDGVHMLQQYNNVSGGGDLGDWLTKCPVLLAQNAQSCRGVPGINIFPTAEIKVLDVIGYTLVGNGAVSFTEFPVPTADSRPSRIAAGPDGALWFTEQGGNKIGRITTAGVITEFPVPTAASQVTKILPGPDGALWFTEQSGNKIGRISTGGVITEFPVPTAASLPVGMTVGPDGALWFAEMAGNKIGRITTTGVVTEFPLPTAAVQPVGVAAGPDGAIWFLEQAVNKIGRITTAGVVTEFPLPTAAAQLVGLTAGPDGGLWFSEQAGNKLGRITTGGVITEYPLPSGGGPSDNTNGSDGAIWFTEISGGKIGRITTAGVITEFPLPTPGTQPNGIAIGPDGALWFTETVANKIGRAAVGPLITQPANAFGDVPLIAPNTWVEIKGSNLAPAGDTRIWLGPDFVNNQLPTQLDGVSVLVNGKSAYVYFISPSQVNVLTPPDALSGLVQVQVTTAGATSNVATVQAQAQSLSFFEFVSSGGRHYVYGRHLAGNSIIGPPGLFPAAPGLTTPVKPGETIYVAGNGFGATDVTVVSGALTQGGTLPKPWPEVAIGGVPATVIFAGLVAPGTFIFNINVPDNLPDGDLALTATYNGLSIQTNLYVTIQH